MKIYLVFLNYIIQF